MSVVLLLDEVIELGLLIEPTPQRERQVLVPTTRAVCLLRLLSCHVGPGSSATWCSHYAEASDRTLI
jgi:hypothetical protein